MQNELSILQKARFVFNLTCLYLMSVLCIGLVVHPPGQAPQYRYAANVLAPVPHAHLVSGVPVRIVIPDSSWLGKVVDLPVDKGYYDASTQEWTLSGYKAQFMTISRPANNISGQTFIYGHNNNDVFGALRHVTPAIGAQALIYTDNGHVFGYRFVTKSDVAPDATSVLDYKGPPVLVVQTCTGSFDQVRTLYYFNFDKVIQ